MPEGMGETTTNFRIIGIPALFEPDAAKMKGRSTVA
jgi:hypothetical protein